MGEGYVPSRYFARADGLRAACTAGTFGGIGIFPGIWMDSKAKAQHSADQCAERVLAEGYVEIDEKTYLAKGGYVPSRSRQLQ